MQVFYVFSCMAIAVAVARPEPPLFMGLPQQNQRVLPLNAHAAKAHVYQQLPLEYNFGNFVAAGPNYNNLPDTIGANHLVPSAAEMGAFEDSYNEAYRHSSQQQHEMGYDHGPVETQVHKHIYVHVPPKDFEEEEAIQPRVRHQGGRKQKHYKIVFIKAPDAPAMHIPSVPPLPQNEEKTLIYVLHKKPETQPDIVIPTPEPTKPSKPEVYFIKYKPKKEKAPVYGPPPAFGEAKSLQSNEDTSINDHGFMPMDFGQYDMDSTTQQAQYQNEEEQQEVQSRLINEESNGNSELYIAPNMNDVVYDNSQATTVAPVSQYLPPDTTMAPIVIQDMAEEPHVPASTYGIPKKTRFFIKKRK